MLTKTTFAGFHHFVGFHRFAGAWSGSTAARCVFIFCSILAAACSDGDGGTSARDAGTLDTVLFDGSILSDGGLTTTANSDAGTNLGEPACLGDCRPTTADSCAGDLSCALVDGQGMCVADVGHGEVGQSCTRSSDCALGHACFEKRTGGECGRVCCDGTEGACGAEERCGGPGLLIEEGLSVASSWRECGAPRSCDVLDTRSCEPGEGCYVVSSEPDTECLAAGTGEVGASCAKQNECRAGLFCAGLVDSRCVRICELGQGCPAGEGRCVAPDMPWPDNAGLCTNGP